MTKIGQALLYYLALVFLFYCTHLVIMNILDFIFTLPDWANDVSFFVIAGIYTYIFIKYRIRIIITMHNKIIFKYQNRKEL